MTPDKLPFVVVVWDDADTGEEAVTVDTVGSYHQATRVTTVGWQVKYDDTGITLVNEFYSHTYRGRTFIPHKMIVSVTPTKLTAPRRKKEKSNEHRPEEVSATVRV